MSFLPTDVNALEEFDQMCAYLGAHGINTNANEKLRAYREFLYLFRDARRDEKTATYNPLMWREFHEFAFAMSFYIDNGISIPEKILKEITKGRVTFSSDDISDQSKNYLLQLRAMAYFIKIGCKPHFDDDCDVVAEKGNQVFFVECKRVYSERKLRVRIREAAKQLRDRMSGDWFARKRKHGVIWIDPTDIVNSGFLFYPCYSLDALKQAMRWEILELVKHIKQSEIREIDRGIKHLVSQIIYPAFSQKLGQPLTLFSTVVNPIDKSLLNIWRGRSLFHQLLNVDETVYSVTQDERKR